MNKPVLRAVGYRRVSMQEQVDGHSLDAQENNIRSFVESQGWTLMKIYTDPGISAKKGSHRPMLERLMKDAQTGKFEVVIVDKIDRFYRHLNGLLTALDELNSHGVSFVSVQERLDFTTPWGKLTLTLLGMLAEIYLDNLRQETRKGLRQRARNGYWNGSIPFGYCKGLCEDCTDPNGKDYCPEYGKSNLSDGKILIPHPIEGEIVKQIYQWYLTREYSHARIAEKLNGMTHQLENGTSLPIRQKGHPGRTKPGPFSKDTLREILHHIFYTGKVPYYGTDPRTGRKRKRRNPAAIYPGKHPALIDEATFQQVQELHALLGSSPNKISSQRRRIYPLTGLLRCGYCGGSMRGSSNGKYFYYRDATQIERTSTCHQPLVRADQIEHQVVDYLLKVLRPLNQNEYLERIQQQKERIKARWERFQTLFLAGEIDREQYELEKERQIEWKNTLPNHGHDAIIPLYQNIYDGLVNWNRILPIEKKRLLRGLVEAVYVKEGGLCGLKPSIASHPLFGGCCSSGDDGI